MKAPRQDYSIRPNRQTQRVQTDLWDVVSGRRDLITTAQSEADAQEIADRLNMDPYALMRGQTRADQPCRHEKNRQREYPDQHGTPHF